MKKSLSILLALILALSLLAGCGGEQSNAANEAGQQSEQPADAPEESKAPEEPVKEEPKGPVELNKVVCDSDGIKVTALSFEDKLSEIDTAGEIDSVLDLKLKVEITDPNVSSASIASASVNGFRYLNYMSFLGGSDPDRMDWLIADGFGPSFKESKEYTISLTKGFASYLDLKSVGEIGLLFNLTGADSKTAFKNVLIDLGQEAQPSCSVALKNGGSYMEYMYADITNPSGSTMLVECLVKAWDKDDQPLFNEKFNYSTGEILLQSGILQNFYIKSGAQEEPCAISAANSMMLYENGDSVSWRDITRIEAELISAVPVQKEDLSSKVSFEQVGRWEESKNFMMYHCTWPEENVKLHVHGTCLVYDEGDQLIRVIPVDDILGRDKDYREFTKAANSETGYMETIAIDCRKEGSGPDFRFELYLNYVTDESE